MNYAAVHGLPMPAAPRGRAHEAPTYLPALCTYKDVHAEYVRQSCDLRILNYQSFVRLWLAKCKSIKFMTRRMDVCYRCELLRDGIQKSRAEDEKIKATEALRSHVILAQKEREYYVKVIDDASDALFRNPADPQFTHLTFDFAEQFVLPHHARQPGPVYYKVMFRVNDFGIINKAAKEQVHHLFHEGQTIGVDNKLNHNPNCVVSMLHAYLQSTLHGRKLHLHCDNCADQNKNKTVMVYMCWRLLCGFEDDIKVSFMVVGHARCSVDGGFGIAKQKYRLGDIDTMEQLSEAITKSSSTNTTACKNCEWRNWDSYLQTHFKRLSGISSYQHFTFTKNRPGEVLMTKTAADEDGVKVQLLRNQDTLNAIGAHVLPDVLPEAGLSNDRRAYLLENVAAFCHAWNKSQFVAALGGEG